LPIEPIAGKAASRASPAKRAVPDEQEADRHHGVQRPAGQDQRPPADVVGEVPAEVAGRGREHRADEIGEPDAALARAELLDRPDAEERDGAAAGERAGQLDGQDRPQRAVDLGAPDEAENGAQEGHDARHRGRVPTAP
jgi:hypothetical protein